MKQFLECPCCGDDGAEADADECFTDGQGLLCGCNGWVSVTEDEVYICIGDDPCGPDALCEYQTDD